MAYQNGTATSPTDLLQKLVSWLSSLGWITDKSATVGAKGGWEAHFHLGTNYVHLRAAINEAIWFSNRVASPTGNDGCGIGLYLSTSFATGSAFNAQPGTPPYQSGSSTSVLGAGMILPPGQIQNYYFFADPNGDNVVVVVEKTAGVFVYIGWGSSLVKSGSYPNGQYFFGSTSAYDMSMTSGNTVNYPGNALTSKCPISNSDPTNGDNYNNAFVRVDVDSWTGKWIGISYSTGATTGYTGKNATSSVANGTPMADTTNCPTYGASGASGDTSDYYLQGHATSVIDGRANLLPCLIWTNRDAGGCSLLGYPPNIFFSNGVGSGFSAAQEYLLGSDTYKLFPNFAIRKQA